jgi:hypothetical protein
MTKFEFMMTEIESKYVDPFDHSNPANQNYSRDVVEMLWKMLVLVENRANTSDLLLFLQKKCLYLTDGIIRILFYYDFFGIFFLK